MKEMNQDEVECCAGGMGVTIAGVLATSGHAGMGAGALKLATLAKGWGPFHKN